MEIDKEQIWEVKDPLKILCCKGQFYPIGQKLHIFHQITPNRVIVCDPKTHYCHKVKFSSLRRCCT